MADQPVLLYRPRSSTELAQYQHLLAAGYVDLAHVYYTDGLKTGYGTMVTELAKSKKAGY